MSATMDRIRKLLALAENEGAAENEADTARRLAERLMAASGLTEADILHGTEEDPAATVGFTVAESAASSWHGVMAMAVARVTGCTVVWWRLNGGRALRWCGTEDQRAAAVELQAFLVRQVERLATNARKSVPADVRSVRSYMHDYRSGVASAVAAQARRLVEAREAQPLEGVALARLDAVQAAIDKLQKQGQRTTRGRRGVAFYQGQAAGNSIALRRSVGSTAPKSRMLGAGGGS